MLQPVLQNVSLLQNAKQNTPNKGNNVCSNSAVSHLLPDIKKKKGTKCPSGMTKIF